MRTIATTIGMVLATVVLLLLVRAVARILIWSLIAGFLAVAMYPLVNAVERAVSRRWLATLLVFLGLVIVLAGLVALMATPLVREGSSLARQAPGVVDQARAGHGPIGNLLERYNLDDYLAAHATEIQQRLTGLGTPALTVLRAAAETVAGTITIFVLSYLMVLEGPKIVDGALTLLPPGRAQRIRRVGADCARTVTGYLSGNLLISVICGSLTFFLLLILDVPFAGLIALFVALTDLIPLIGATLGAVVAIAAAFWHSTTAGVAAIVFFVVYQQAENHLLQPLILSRTVKLNPLTVLLAILVGVELAGILGALLAIPVAGVAQVVVRDVYDNRRGRLKEEPTVGENRIPVDRLAAAADAGRADDPAGRSADPAGRPADARAPVSRPGADGTPAPVGGELPRERRRPAEPALQESREPGGSRDPGG